MPIDIPKKGTLQRKNDDKLWSAELQHKIIIRIMFIGSFVFRFIGLIVKWIISGFKGDGIWSGWAQRKPDKEFEDILVGAVAIIIMTILLF